MKLKTESKTNRHQNGQNITKNVLIIEDDFNREILRENWDSKHPLWGLKLNNLSKIEELVIRQRYGI